ncbi:MAG: alpha/beta hydrolase [Porticoccaceae bacterium]|nr:alpha/beta fold hydrolase [Pseudomonadales bacterium]MCP5172408.1 alpha/beta fold hydrolase [Pseudomonadales bacterium]
MNATQNPEIGKRIDIGNCEVNYQDEGQGEAIILLHGSGPGVTGYANWRLLIPVLAKDFRVIAPDVVGFGYTSHPEGFVYNLENWIDWTIRFMDALGIEKAGFVGNSFGGALALAVAAKHPDRVTRFVMMGAAGIEFKVTEGLAKVWGYTPSFENMRELMNTFAFEGEQISDEIVESRYQASIRPGYQEAYSQLFPEPYQEQLDALRLPEEEIAKVKHPVMMVHGTEDAIVPVDCSFRAQKLLENADLHVYSKCGHWTMFERPYEFGQLVHSFFSKENA